MLTKALYSLYGWLVRIPRVGPGFDRWVRARRGWAYRLRDWALAWDRRLRLGAGGAEVASLREAIHDLGWMVAGLRDAVGRIEERLQGVEQRDLAEPVLAELARHSHAMNLKVDGAIEALTRRVERAERQLGQVTVAATRPVLEPRILNPEKLAQQRERPEGVWLEVGCGERPDPERINVDLRPLPGVDIVARAEQIPLPDGWVRDLRASHLVEHFTLQQLVDQVLPEWWRLLAPGGQLRLVTPDLEAMLRAHWAGALSESDLVHVLFGGQDYDGDFHYHAYSPESLSSLLSAFGFVAVTVVAQGRRNGLCFEFELVASKPS
ncbi:class I SAM-dependent methyltransferase [Hydrogenophilus hirschii]